MKSDRLFLDILFNILPELSFFTVNVGESMNDEYKLSDDLDKLHLTLDRTIGFISNCDTKVSFWLSSLGVIFTILFTVKIPHFNFIVEKVSSLQSNIDGYFILGVFAFCLSLCLTVRGIYFLTQVLIAKTECNGYPNSKIFFGHIAKFSNYRDYFDKVQLTNLEQYKEDLISQIYTNSQICNEKFKNYNKGAKSCIYALPFLIWSWSYIFQ